MSIPKLVLLLISSSLSLCPIAGAKAQAASGEKRPKPRPQDCIATVQPVRNTPLTFTSTWNVPFVTTGTPAEVREKSRKYLVLELNELGRSDGNSFRESEGEQPNIYLNFIVNNDGQDRYVGSLTMIAWGNLKTTINKADYPYNTITVMLDAMLADAYRYFHEGWMDQRPACNS